MRDLPSSNSGLREAVENGWPLLYLRASKVHGTHRACQKKNPETEGTRKGRGDLTTDKTGFTRMGKEGLERNTETEEEEFTAKTAKERIL